MVFNQKIRKEVEEKAIIESKIRTQLQQKSTRRYIHLRFAQDFLHTFMGFSGAFDEQRFFCLTKI